MDWNWTSQGDFMFTHSWTDTETGIVVYMSIRPSPDH